MKTKYRIKAETKANGHVSYTIQKKDGLIGFWHHYQSVTDGKMEALNLLVMYRNSEVQYQASKKVVKREYIQ